MVYQVPHTVWSLAPSTFLLFFHLHLLGSHWPSGGFLTYQEHFCLWAFALAVPLAWNILLQDFCRANSLTSFKSLLQSLTRPTLTTIL